MPRLCMMNNNGRQRVKYKITFLTFQLLDLFLSKTAYVELSKKLAERGNQIDFFGVGSRWVLKFRNKAMHEIAIPMKIFPIVTHMFYLILLILILPFYIAVKRPDFIIFEPKFGSSLLALELKLFPPSLKPKMLLDIRSTIVGMPTFRRFLGEFAFNFSVVTATKMFDGITIVTNRMKEEVCQKFLLNPEFIRVWHNGVDLDLFRSRKSEGREMRKRLGLSDRFIVFYHGAFRENGGIKETIQSIQILKKDYPSITLFLLGAGPGLKSFENLVRENKLEDRVVIHKPVNYFEVPKYIAMADVGIVPLPDIPDWRNQSPLKLIEYLAMEKVVIATDIPANREVIGEEDCGIYVSAASPEAIAEAILNAYNNREKLEKWGASGRARVKEEYDWRTIAQSFEKYLHSLSTC